MRLIPPSLLLALVLPAAPAFGNCEVGGYSIHTLAEYKPSEPHRFVLPYWKEGGGRLGFAPSYVEGEPVNALASPTLRLEHAGAVCANPSYTSIERYHAPHDIQHRLDATACGALFENLPTHGYAFVDTTRFVMSFADALPIDFVSLGEEDLASLEAEIAAQLPRLPLYAESGPGGREGRGRIDASHIRGMRLEPTSVGLGPRPFVLAIAVLDLTGVDALYDLSYFGERLPARLRAEDRLEYPVIFFRRAGGAPTYAGDGSWCASVRVGDLLGRGGHAAPERGSSSLLGAAERFRLTGAFDANGDGAPDVLEVNERFAYLLEPDGRFFVIRIGAGC